MFVISPINELVVSLLVLQNTHLGVHIVLHAEAIAVEMVGRNVQQHGNVGAEAEHIVQLERRQLNDIPVVTGGGHLIGQAVADVTGQTYVETGFPEI